MVVRNLDGGIIYGRKAATAISLTESRKESVLVCDILQLIALLLVSFIVIPAVIHKALTFYFLHHLFDSFDLNKQTTYYPVSVFSLPLSLSTATVFGHIPTVAFPAILL